MSLWEVLVPTITPNGRPIRTRFHRCWDEKVKAITGGLTILTPVQGKWVSPNKETLTERMIPVRIACTREQIEKIIPMTAKYYDQIEVFCYRISDLVLRGNKNGIIKD